MGIKLSNKTLDFLATPSRIDVLEGGGRTSKSTSLMIKFGRRVNNSTQRQFIISASDAVVARRNLIDSPNGFLELFAGMAKNGTDTKLGSHLVFIDSHGVKKYIYIVGFKDKARWTKLLGSTIGAVMIDECNLADPAFIAQCFRGLSSVADGYIGCTLNPANPDLEIYNTLINRCRPVKRWAQTIPRSIWQELVKNTDLLEGGYYWHFDFNDNPIMTADKIRRFKSIYPIDSFYYKSLVLGERGVTEGTIFGQYLSKDNDTAVDYPRPMGAWQEEYNSFGIGIDLGNNDIKRGTIMTLTGIRKGFSGAVVIDAYQAESTEANELAAEIANKIAEWDDYINRPAKLRNAWVDGYGAIQILLPTIRKKLFAMNRRSIAIDLCEKFSETGGRGPRMMLLLLLITQRKLQFNVQKRGAMESKRQLTYIVYDDKSGLPKDENKIENDYYDSLCYSITHWSKRLTDTLQTFK